jgi:uncharacterized caspase-like protein
MEYEPNEAEEPPTPAPPPDVVELAHSGNRLEAIRRYRALRGGSYEDAQTAIGDV